MVSINWKKLWEDWNIRGFILLSLCLQFILIISGSSRKRTKGILVAIVWFIYLLADWVAGFSVGLITKSRLGKSTTTKDDYLTAFWAQFLLLHLGGPDTITAFSLEDNELWRRHVSSLFLQAITAGHVFLLTVPGNTLWLPTVLLFLAGLIKYAERNFALYFGSINTFRKSLVQEPDPGPNYAKLMEEYSSRIKAGFPAKIDVVPEDDQAPDEEEELVNDLREVRKAYDFFEKFKGLIVDMIYSFGDRRLSQKYFRNIEAEEALRVIEIELNFMYEYFYTKASIVRHWFGSLCKFVSFMSVVIAFGIFTSFEKHGFNKTDVRVTYTLLYGALALDIMAFFMLFFTDYTTASSFKSLEDSKGACSCFQRLKIWFLKRFSEKILVHFLRWKKPSWNKIYQKDPYEGYEYLSTPHLCRRWSGSISGYNLLTYCLDQSVTKVPNIGGWGLCIAILIQGCFKISLFVKDVFRKFKLAKRFGVQDLLDQWNYKENNPFLKRLWKYIFDELKEKSYRAQDAMTIQSICSARGEWVVNELWESIFEDAEAIQSIASTSEEVESIRKDLMPFVDPEEVVFDQSVLLWHIATHICYAQDKRDHNEERRDFSRLLSDYMLYLLVMQPNMMSAVAGIGKIRFQDTCAEAKRFFSERSIKSRDPNEMEEEACNILMEVPTEQKPIDVKGDRSKSLLFDACMLAEVLKKLKDKKWEFIFGVWVELLSFAASHCRPTTHVQVLSEGGELVSFVWLLMIQLGLGTQFQIKEGHARAKLVVDQLRNPLA